MTTVHKSIASMVSHLITKMRHSYLFEVSVCQNLKVMIFVRFATRLVSSLQTFVLETSIRCTRNWPTRTREAFERGHFEWRNQRNRSSKSIKYSTLYLLILVTSRAWSHKNRTGRVQIEMGRSLGRQSIFACSFGSKRHFNSGRTPSKETSTALIFYYWCIYCGGINQ